MEVIVRRRFVFRLPLGHLAEKIAQLVLPLRSLPGLKRQRLGRLVRFRSGSLFRGLTEAQDIDFLKEAPGAPCSPVRIKQGLAIYLTGFDVVIGDLRNIFVLVQCRVKAGHEFRRAGALYIARQVIGAARRAQLSDYIIAIASEQEVRRKPALLALSGERERRG